ncbi:hypothetical protein [Rhizobium sp. BK176]|uniref:hypothetical protein n=1 Tax=Rhizobium sp. BK176 TaxID=2587071 RepID=UPI002168CB14|nr:hypothetical protein [Rhizobium sp. BK176]MCS4088642.1 hypothetical protein [Rhizobium sp. BK176]
MTIVYQPSPPHAKEAADKWACPGEPTPEYLSPAIPVYTMTAAEAADGALRSLTPTRWRFPVQLDDGPGLADVKAYENIEFASLSYGRYAEKLWNCIQTIVAEEASNPSECNLRMLESPSIQLVAFWVVDGAADRFGVLNLIDDGRPLTVKMDRTTFLGHIAEKVAERERAHAAALEIYGEDASSLGG